MVKNELIVLRWEVAKGLDIRIEINFVADGDDQTIVKIAETGWRETQSDLDSSYMNCFGWAQMTMCLKAYTEHNINLRKGAYQGLYNTSDDTENNDLNANPA